MLSQALVWVVFWGGIFVIVVFARYATAGSQSNFLFGFSEPCKGSPWIQGLLGQRVRLPDNDAQGFSIPHKKQFAISFNCSSCGSKSDLRKALRIAYIKPVLVFVTGDLRELSREWFDDSEEVLLIQDTYAKFAPREMLEKAPQAILIDENGRICAVPKPFESIASFLSSGGKQ